MINRIDRWLYFENAADFCGWRVDGGGERRCELARPSKLSFSNKIIEIRKPLFQAVRADPERTIYFLWPGNHCTHMTHLRFCGKIIQDLACKLMMANTITVVAFKRSHLEDRRDHIEAVSMRVGDACMIQEATQVSQQW